MWQQDRVCQKVQQFGVSFRCLCRNMNCACVCVCIGPFVGDYGHAAYGHAAFLHKSKKYVEKQIILDTKRDLLTSVAAVIRSIATHHPDIVVGSGHGGAVAIALASPLLLEVCLAARNFKTP